MKRTYSLFLALVMAVLFAVPAFAVPTNIATKTLPSINGTLAANSVDVGPGTAVDVSNGNSTVHPGKICFIVQNTHASNAYTFTVTSAADKLGRTGDHSAYSLAAGEIGFFGPYPLEGWAQTDGTIRFTGENAAVKVTPVALP